MYPHLYTHTLYPHPHPHPHACIHTHIQRFVRMSMILFRDRGCLRSKARASHSLSFIQASDSARERESERKRGGGKGEGWEEERTGIVARRVQMGPSRTIKDVSVDGEDSLNQEFQLPRHIANVPYLNSEDCVKSQDCVVPSRH